MTLAERMCALLRGHQGAHGTYREEVQNPETGKMEIRDSARTVRTPPTVELWDEHLAGESRLGVITIGEDDCCWWGAVDIDDYTVQHMDLVAALSDMQVPASVCRTKSGGAHVLLFFSEPIPAVEVMPRLRQLAGALGHGECEVFPKQTHVVREAEGLGSWLNMPYFGGDTSRNFCYGDNGLGMSLEAFLDRAESSRLSKSQFMALRFVAGGDQDSWSDAPPCLEYLAEHRNIRPGTQNNAIFGLCVLAKRMHPTGWEDSVRGWARDFCRPAHDPVRLDRTIRSVAKKDYSYKCHDIPCVNHCNVALCRTRRYGIGDSEATSGNIIASMSILDTEPPIFYVTLKTGSTVECDGATMLSPRDFRRVTLEQTQTVVPHYPDDTWGPWVTAAVNAAIKIEAGPEIGRTGEFRELLQRFCTDRHAASVREEVRLDKPWRDSETDMVWFTMHALMGFLYRSRFNDMRRPHVIQKIRELGGRMDTFAGELHVWGVPFGSLVWRSQEIAPPEVDQGPV